ncbi:N-acetylglucosamine-6-phosphate deacetylase [Alkalicoccus daliensis]|uniref:N-acetylglucosamine-6-phosphate deacetylase n=1 Tax=Alkalicoccus daliensis TaxID=745820 RepID=A0A1H0EU40_9BACI|nr:N-acetylglucosamine-6-phosphate deacetylase [Alkalicoccus daliensis]SDN85914.1 N-acetylglucosamine-6-phosphate deacetylase [Alkalicoccus daliensis]
MKTIRIPKAEAYTEKGKINDIVMSINQDGKWESLTSYKGEQVDEVYDYGTSSIIVPGFIDTHIHGAAGADVMDATPEAIKKISAALPAEGTTSYLPTTLTQSREDTIRALKNAAAVSCSGAEAAGIHLEGPFINAVRKGAQPEAFILPPDREIFMEFQQAAQNRIKIITTAPELDKDQFIKTLSRQGVVVSMGHTDASYSEAAVSFHQGVTQATHFFNGMRGFHHRDLGVVGAVYMSKEIRAELIADGVHVSPEAAEYTYKQLGAERITLITDAMRAKGLSDGSYQLGGQEVQVTGNQAVLKDGTLAGSVLKMNEAFRNIMQFTGCSIEEAIMMTSTNAAEVLKIEDIKGSIAIGKDADFTMLDKAFNVLMTSVKGEVVYQGGAS